MNNKKKTIFIVVFIIIALGALWFMRKNAQSNGQTASLFVMDTVVSQKMYDTDATSIMNEVNEALKKFEDEVSAYMPQSDVFAINQAAGIEPVSVKPRTYELLLHAKELSATADNSFAITIAPLSMAWGITSENPRVVTPKERTELLKLVDDNTLILENNTAFLKSKGQGIDLGGIAKGTACEVAREIYEKNNADFALFNMGGSCIYVKGKKPDGSMVRVGFRDPLKDENASIASFTMSDMVFSTSGGYERYFEEEGVKYHHILDPKTGAPADSDIVSIGVMCKDGSESDFLSTSLFVRGKDASLEYMNNGGICILLDKENNLYVSKSLESSFQLLESDVAYNVIFI